MQKIGWKFRFNFLGVFVCSFLFCGMRVNLFAEPLDKIAKKISAGAKELQNKKVAVLPFSYHDGSESQGSTIISERLITRLVERRKLEVIERSLMEKVLKELQLQSSGAVDEESAKQIGKILGVEAIVTGTLIDLGEENIEVNARLIMAETGQIIKAVSGNIKRFWQEEIKTVQRSSHLPPAVPVSPEQGHGEKMDRKDHSSQDLQEIPPVELESPSDLPEQDRGEGGEGGGEKGVEGKDPLSKGFQEFSLVESEFPLDIMQGRFGREILFGLTLLENGEEARAEKFFAGLHREYGRENPRLSGVIQLGYSLSLFQQGKEEKAVALAQKVAERKEWQKISAIAHFILGKYSESFGKFEEAERQYLEIVRLIPFRTPLVRAASDQLRKLGLDRPIMQKGAREMRRRMRREKRRW